MPSEDRRIIFDYEEVYKAIYALCAQKQLKKPPAGALSNVYEEDNGVSIILYLINPQDKDNPNVEVEYQRDFLAAALMLFCKGLGIPLPKSAKKSVLIREGTVMLRVQI